MWPAGGVKVGPSSASPAGRYGAAQARALLAVSGACSSVLHEVRLPELPSEGQGEGGLLPVQVVRALATYDGPHGPTSALQMSSDGKHLLQSGLDGVVAVRPVLQPSRFLAVEAAGADAGGAVAARLVAGPDAGLGSFLVVASGDGAVPVFRLRLRELD